MSCQSSGRIKWFYTGNQVGFLNHVGLMNFASGGLTGLSASDVVPLEVRDASKREIWNDVTAEMSQELLDGAYPFIELQFIIDVYLPQETLRLSNKNIYVQDINQNPRFYEARIVSAPSISISLGEWLNANFEVGELPIKINNRDGKYNDYLPNGTSYSQWINSKVEVKVGFGEKYENYFLVFEGYISQKKSVETTDREITIRALNTYDKDETPIPVRSFDAISYPNIDETYSGKPIPLLYGDWTEDVGDWGEIPAICTNAYETNPEYYEFWLADNSLISIDAVYLHRGYRTAEQNTPIQFSDGAIIKNLGSGKFQIPATGTVLNEYYFVVDKQQAGSGSGLNTITSQNNQINFITSGVKVGDRVQKLSTGQIGYVSTVGNFALTCSGGITFNSGDDYTIATSQFKFLKEDKISVKCKGKKLNNISTNRVTDVITTSTSPSCLALGLDGSYFFVDNDLQKIYEISFKNVKLREINFSDVDSGITFISGLAYQTDNTLWMIDKNNSTVYHYDLNQNAVTLSFTTASVSGVGNLGEAYGLAIDQNNYVYLSSQTYQIVYQINVFATGGPALVHSYSITAFDPLAINIMDLSSDVNALNLVVIDRSTNKVYRINQDTGALISSFNLSEIGTLTYPSGVASSFDGTLFVLDRNSKAVYNYNEYANCSYNVGFIARDLIQTNTTRTSDDFDLGFNNICISQLSVYKGRMYISDRENLITSLNKYLTQYNANIFIKFQRYALFYIDFQNFASDGRPIREGDIKMSSFNPQKEYNQYFNVAYAEYQKRPFSSKKLLSDTYTSQKALMLVANKRVLKKLDLIDVYRREDVDRLLPLYIRLASAEPEFVQMTLGFRFLFTQLNDFFKINFDDVYNLIQGKKVGGRRFSEIPCFIRKLEFDLSNMSIRVKAWSLGTTSFGDFIAQGDVSGGEDDPVTLNNVGTRGYISPIGTITEGDQSYVKIEDVDGFDAQNRSFDVVGLAWAPDYFVSIVDAATQEVLATAQIDTVVGNQINFKTALSITPNLSVKNEAGFITSGHLIRYSDYDEINATQKQWYSSYTKPLTGYPQFTSTEGDEQRAGLHNFDDNRWPYLLYPKDYVEG